MEMVGPGKRTLFGLGYSVAFAVGLMLVAFWAAIIPEAWLLQTILALHAILLLCGSM